MEREKECGRWVVGGFVREETERLDVFWNERKNRKAGVMVVCQRKILFFFSPIFNLRVACRKDCALLRS